MTKCVFCGNDDATDGVPDLLNDTSNGVFTHEPCKLEWNRRFNDDLCTVCGDGLDSDEKFQWCNKCHSKSPYLGYPGDLR